MLTKLLHHLHYEGEINTIMETVVNVGLTNLAMISHFVKIPEDILLTEEYSIRAARIAVYTLLGINKKIYPVTPHHRDVRTLLKAVTTSFRYADPKL